MDGERAYSNRCVSGRNNNEYIAHLHAYAIRAAYSAYMFLCVSVFADR